MVCPNCKSKNMQNNLCLDCGINLDIYNDINDLSDSFYNKGLKMINEDNITEAIDCMHKSLQSNRKNVQARNLLALLYIETGDIYKGINEFELGVELNDDNEVAKDYLKTINSYTNKLEELEEANKIYNQALIYIKQSSDDMAVIQLKKAIETNPKFLEAINLLTVCYIYLDKKDLAIENIDKVLQMDIGNEKALYYRSVLGITKPIKIKNKAVKEKKEAKTQRIPTFNYQEDNRNGFGIYNFIYIVIGLIIGVGIFYILIIPEMTNSNKKIIDENRASIEKLEIENEKLLAENTKTITDLEETKKNLEMRNQELEEKVSINDRIQNLNTASDLINRGDYEEASILLNSFDKTGLEEELMDKYDDLVGRSHPRTANLLYQRGVSKYRARDYDEAETGFKECQKYADKESSQYGDSYYYLGEIALTRDDEIQANKYFEIVVNDYKNIAKNYWSAKSRLQ